MSCAVMSQPYPTSSPYLLPSSGPPGPPTPNAAHHHLPSLAGFDRLPATVSAVAAAAVASAASSAAATVTPPVNSPQSPTQQQHQHHQHQQSHHSLHHSNGLLHGVEPKVEKVNIQIFRPRPH